MRFIYPFTAGSGLEEAYSPSRRHRQYHHASGVAKKLSKNLNAFWCIIKKKRTLKKPTEASEADRLAVDIVNVLGIIDCCCECGTKPKNNEALGGCTTYGKGMAPMCNNSTVL